jgi:hypothetical protein
MSDSSISDSSSSSKSLMFMMLALAAGLGVMLGGGLFIANTLLHSMGLAVAHNNKNTVRTPIGSFRMEGQNQIGPGLPVYPRASLELPSSDTTGQAMQQAQEGVITATYHTEDDRDAVETWYAQHLSPEYTRHDGSERPLPEAFRILPVGDGDISFLAERGSNIRAITLSADAGGTKIGLLQARTGEAAKAP